MVSFVEFITLPIIVYRFLSGPMAIYPPLFSGPGVEGNCNNNFGLVNLFPTNSYLYILCPNFSILESEILVLFDGLLLFASIKDKNTYVVFVLLFFDTALPSKPW